MGSIKRKGDTKMPIMIPDDVALHPIYKTFFEGVIGGEDNASAIDMYNMMYLMQRFCKTTKVTATVVRNVICDDNKNVNVVAFLVSEYFSGTYDKG
jgi:hypothetical protein